MDAGSHQSRLETVSSLASSLADEILSERLENGSFSPEKGDALAKASLLLEDCAHPIPDVVTDALTQCHRRVADDGPSEPSASLQAVGGRVSAAGAKGAFLRFIRSVRPAALA